MAKNFSSVLEALKGAGAGKQAEVERSYAANCEWLLQQFKAAQASFAELKADDKAEQQVHQVCLIVHSCSGTPWLSRKADALLQSTAKSRSQHTGEAEPAVSTDPHVTEQQGRFWSNGLCKNFTTIGLNQRADIKCWLYHNPRSCHPCLSPLSPLL